MAAKTVMLTGSFGDTFLAPDAGWAVTRTPFSTVVVATVDASAAVALEVGGAGDEAIGLVGSGADRSGEAAVCSAVTVTVTTCCPAEHADAAAARITAAATHLNFNRRPALDVGLFITSSPHLCCWRDGYVAHCSVAGAARRTPEQARPEALRVYGLSRYISAGWSSGAPA